MSITKKDLAKEISKNCDINHSSSHKIIDKFIALIKSKSKFQHVKISNFGTFLYRNTPKRVGRNPKTKESYIITPRKRLRLNVSNEIKKFLN